MMLASVPAAALTITTDQVTSAIGGTALGVVGGPIGGFIGGVLGKEVGKSIERKRHGLDWAPPAEAGKAQPIAARVIDPGINDRAVDSTPMRVLDSGPPLQADGSLARRAPSRPASGLTLAASPGPGAGGPPPGTLDYQLSQIVARHPEMRASLMQVADRR